MIFKLLKAHTNLGSVIKVVGSNSLLGNWDQDKGIELKTKDNEYPTWSSRRLIIPESIEFEYKYVICNASSTEWESGPNRKASIQARQKDKVHVIID